MEFGTEEWRNPSQDESHCLLAGSTHYERINPEQVSWDELRRFLQIKQHNPVNLRPMEQTIQILFAPKWDAALFI